MICMYIYNIYLYIFIYNQLISYLQSTTLWLMSFFWELEFEVAGCSSRILDIIKLVRFSFWFESFTLTVFVLSSLCPSLSENSLSNIESRVSLSLPSFSSWIEDIEEDILFSFWYLKIRILLT